MGSDKSAVCAFLLADNRLLLDVFVRLLARKNDIEVVGASPFTRQAILQVVAANPDVVLCDSLASALSGDDLLLELKHNLPNAKILLFGMDSDPENFLDCRRAWSNGLRTQRCFCFRSGQRDPSSSTGAGHLPSDIVPGPLRSHRELCFLAAGHAGAAESWSHSPRATTGAVGQRRAHQQRNCLTPLSI